MVYLVDTDWIISWLKGKQAVVEKLKELSKHSLAVSVISVAEIYDGIYGSKNPERHEDVFKEFLTGVTVIDVDEGVCKKFGELRNYLRNRGELIGDFDTLIAATAISRNAFLLTDNIKHYAKIKNIKIGP
ncbi:MAG: type II toxin-antitoxin system VapC family toxin [Candidatus Aenigmarchaeota archaeon]|nr:type II toxin-antitoxin system VapC family toxin [Candidatus Aenigmarchaeota archaeon]